MAVKVIDVKVGVFDETTKAAQGLCNYLTQPTIVASATGLRRILFIFALERMIS